MNMDTRSDAVRQFVPKRPDDFLTGAVKYEYVEIHDQIGIHPTVVDSMQTGSLKFRVNTDIEFIGVNIYGFDTDISASTSDGVETFLQGWKSRNKIQQLELGLGYTHSGSFEIFDVDGNGIESNKCQTYSARKNFYDLLFPMTVALEANMWYKLDFQIKGPTNRYGKEMKANVDAIDTTKFVFKNGVNQQVISSLCYNRLGNEQNRLPPADGNYKKVYTVERYENIGFRRLEREENGIITFKVSCPVELMAIRFFGLKRNPSEERKRDCIGVSVNTAGFSIRTENGLEVHNNGFMVLSVTDEAETFEVPATTPIKLEADVNYELGFKIRGPKRRYGLDLLSSVSVKNEIVFDDRVHRMPGSSVTFNFLTEIRSNQLAGLDFRFAETPLGKIFLDRFASFDEQTKNSDKKSGSRRPFEETFSDNLRNNCRQQ